MRSQIRRDVVSPHVRISSIAQSGLPFHKQNVTTASHLPVLTQYTCTAIIIR